MASTGQHLLVKWHASICLGVPHMCSRRLCGHLKLLHWATRSRFAGSAGRFVGVSIEHTPCRQQLCIQLANCALNRLNGQHAECRHYYSIAITYRKNELEEKMLMNLQKKTWTHGLTLKYVPGNADPVI